MSKYRIFRDLKIILYIIRKAKLFAVFVVFLLLHVHVMAQGKLAAPIEMPQVKQASIRQLFATLDEKYAIKFSYNSHLLHVDSVVSVGAFKGPCIDYLESLFGANYAFKEADTHIILTYAPQRMEVVVNMNTDHRNRAVISGYVRDLRTDRAIAEASVYDKLTFDVATLSDKQGYFQLDIKRHDQMVAISLSKANYKDTSIVLLLPVRALTPSEKKRSMGYYAGHGGERNVFNNFFGRLLTNSSQRVQSMNLGGFFAYSPFQLSLTPGLSTHGFFDSQVVNRFSLNIIGGSTAGVAGTELAGAFNVNQYDMQGAQFSGLLNVVGGNVRGLHVAGGGNVVLHNVYGTQLAGVWNNADTLAKGIQVAGGMNFVKQAHGLQIAGVSNVSRHAAGSQLAGGMNLAKGHLGLQVAGGANVSRGLSGSQIAGGINIAKRVKGLQFAGLLNIADSSDYPIAVLNLIRNGRKDIALQFDESRLWSVHFRSGGRVLYSMLAFGRYMDHPDVQYAAEFGLGAQLLAKRRFALALEVVQRSHFDQDFRHQEAQRYSLRVMPSWRFAPHWMLYAAPTANYSEATVDVPLPGSQWNLWGADRQQNTFHLGGGLGLSFSF